MQILYTEKLSPGSTYLVMQKFRQRHLQLLVATDVAAIRLDGQPELMWLITVLPDDIEAIRIQVVVQDVPEKQEFRCHY